MAFAHKWLVDDDDHDHDDDDADHRIFNGQINSYSVRLYGQFERDFQLVYGIFSWYENCIWRWCE